MNTHMFRLSWLQSHIFLVHDLINGFVTRVKSGVDSGVRKGYVVSASYKTTYPLRTPESTPVFWLGPCQLIYSDNFFRLLKGTCYYLRTLHTTVTCDNNHAPSPLPQYVFSFIYCVVFPSPIYDFWLHHCCFLAVFLFNWYIKIFVCILYLQVFSYIFKGTSI